MILSENLFLVWHAGTPAFSPVLAVIIKIPGLKPGVFLFRYVRPLLMEAGDI